MSQDLRSLAYSHIYEMFVDGRLKPGNRLSNRRLAKQIGISFTPVREAISQLVSEGLVEHRPGLGSFVREVTRDELVQLYDLREALECHAVSKIANALSESQWDAMARHNTELTAIADEVEESGAAARGGAQINRWLLADASFHMVILRALGNPKAVKIVSDLRLMTCIFCQRIESDSLAGLRRTAAAHAAILEALKKGDAEEARSAMKSHIQQGCARVLEEFDKSQPNGQLDEQQDNTFDSILRRQLHEMEENLI